MAILLNLVKADIIQVPGNKQAFFVRNMRNKRHMIYMLLAHLEQAGVAVIHAAEERDVLIIIVRKAIELGEHDGVVAIADDTQTLVILVYHAHSSHQFYMEMNQHIIAIDAALQALSDICRNLFFVHAMTGCYAKSAMFGVGKIKAF